MEVVTSGGSSPSYLDAVSPVVVVISGGSSPNYLDAVSPVVVVTSGGSSPNYLTTWMHSHQSLNLTMTDIQHHGTAGFLLRGVRGVKAGQRGSRAQLFLTRLF